MKFVTVNDKLAPIRLLRLVGTITDAGLAEFLAAERRTKRGHEAAQERWVDVLDCRRLAGLSPAQVELCTEWLFDNLSTIAKASLGIAVVLPLELVESARCFFEQVEDVRGYVDSELESALDQAIAWTFDDDDVALDPDLVLGGSGAFRMVWV